MATKWTYKLERFALFGSLVAAMIGMFFITKEAYFLIMEHSEPAIQTLLHLLRSGKQ